MVDLPTVPDHIVTSTAPQSSVSRSDIIGSSNLMAKAIGDVADAQMDIATRQAKDQAAEDLQKQKVTLNADGSVSVANPANSLIFGRAGEQYHAAVQAGTIAQHSNVISQEMNDLHQKFPTDPEAFKTAADAWKTTYLQEHGGGQVGLAISQQADQVQTQHAMSITNAAGTNDLKQQDSSLSANQASARNDVMAMLRGGADVNDPAVQGKIAQFDATTEARAGNPLFAYSKEQAALDRDTFHSEAAASRLLYNVNKIYKDPGENGGKNNAIAAAQDILTNPNYKLSEQQRELFYHKAVGEIRANEAIRKQDIGEARAAASELRLQFASGAGVGSDDVEQVAKGFEAAGDPGGAASLRASFLRKPLIDDHGNQPLATQTKHLMAVQGMNAIRSDVQTLIGKGYSPMAAAAMGSHFIHESSGDPGSFTASDAGTGPSGGLAQWHNERLTALKSFAATQNKPWTDRATQLDFLDRELHSPAQAGTLAKLQAAKTPEEAAAAFYDFEKPAGWKPGDATGVKDYSSRLGMARQIFDGSGRDMSMGPAGSAWLIAHRQIAVSDAATTQWKTVMSDYDKENTRPSLQVINDVQQAAMATRNGALLDQIDADTMRMNIAGDSAQQPLPVQAAQNTQLTAAGQRGELPPALTSLQKDLQSRTNAITKGLKDDPIATAVTNFPTKLQLPPPLDFSNDKALADGMKARGQIAQFAAQNWQTPPVAALDSAEVQQVHGLLENPDPSVKGRVFNALSALPEDVRNATLAKIGRDNPNLMVSVAAGSMMHNAPGIAASVISGQHSIDAKLGYLPEKGTEGDAFDQKLKEHIPASMFSPESVADASGRYAVGQGLVKARYADLSRLSYDTSGKFNADRMAQAVTDVTGGILDHNGGKLIAPVRGMPQDVFDRTMAGISDDDLKGVTSAQGEAISANYLRNNATLESMGDGRYQVKLGRDPLKPIYAYQGANTEAPVKFMLDLRNRPLGAVAPVTPAVQP